MNISPNPPIDLVKKLLAEAQLPTDDLARMEHFLGAWEGAELVGTVGLEPLGSVGLVRSLAVTASMRGRGIGGDLLNRIEAHAADMGLRSLFLLTITAADFFEARGYSRISRAEAPEPIRGTVQFDCACPASAVLMMKRLPT